ncbi:MAG: FtsQ-type POTRA domain-containing protein [Propionibacteriaceae bacterium]|nr:FtsQ-type POTRA domain-containing protein [Propionibacteriaceae bacterium]
MSTTPGEFARALQAKRRRQRRARLLILSAVASVLVLVGVATWLFGFSSVFAAKQVRVTGVSLLSEDQVSQVAAVDLGRPLATLDLGNVRERVATLAPVDEVKVERRFPDTVEITITERTLSYLWSDGTTLRWVDSEGVVFHEGGEPPAGMVTAQVDAPDQRLLQDVSTVVQAVVPVLGERITLVRATAVDQIEIRLDDGDTVVWGSADESELKAQVLAVLLKQEASVYDVSAPEAPTTR